MSPRTRRTIETLTLPEPPARVHWGDIAALGGLLALILSMLLLAGCGAQQAQQPAVALGDVDLQASGARSAGGDYTMDVCARVVVLVYGMPATLHACEVRLDDGAMCTIATLEAAGWVAGGALPVGGEVCQQRFGSFRAAPIGAAAGGPAMVDGAP